MEQEFHSGRRLALLRELKSLSQKEIVVTQGFPKTSVRNLQRWERQGIPRNHIQAIAQFFEVGPWVLLDPNVEETQLRTLALHPELQDWIQQQMVRAIFQDTVDRAASSIKLESV